MRAYKLTPEQVDEAKALFLDGWKFLSIGEKFDCDPKTIRRAVDPEYQHRRCIQVREARLRREATQTRDPRAGRENATGAAVHIDAAARLAEIPPDTRSLTQRLCGDPLPGRDALSRRATLLHGSVRS